MHTPGAPHNGVTVERVLTDNAWSCTSDLPLPVVEPVHVRAVEFGCFPFEARRDR
ncbi:hypothetical protein [Parasphingorhabdus pacifica]